MGVDKGHVKHKRPLQWIDDIVQMCQPKDLFWCDGSREEYDDLTDQTVATGSAIPLQQRHRGFLLRSDPSDVGRVEDRTFIGTTKQIDAGPTNNWVETGELKRITRRLMMRA